ncbi:ARID domain-containing protein [Mycena indigotica]|uniref:ARID domain-containing protein n=1 Tax=Mycena indigotica TaxID=2126181 RepID=A0A8H6SXR8_9AGAR|nr:ARID domain-containing protein [Mycena indigotica]KAF7306742.1 ARID domain-containing protein [Mycena indigotica]
MQSFDGAGLFPLDAAQAKQMAAINAANNLRNRSTSFLGESSTLLQDPAAMAQRPQQPPPSRQHGFLVSLAGVMAKRNTPLPPALTGVQTPGYDALSSTWQMLDIPDVGVIRIAGRDIELLKLWGLVKQSGGGQHLTTQNLWVNILPSFQLTEETLPTGLTVTQTLATYYQNILLPLEEVYRNNMQGKVHGVQRQPLPETPARRLSSASQGSVQNPEGTLENNDQDLGLKRKLESEEGDVKRARQKTGACTQSFDEQKQAR